MDIDLSKFPDTFFLSDVLPQFVFYDRKSKEPFTEVTKPKYKLNGNSFSMLSVYVFWPLTSQEYCKPSYRFEIKKSEWEELDKDYLKGDVSYLDVRKCDVLRGEEIASKCRDISNRFRKVARLSDTKFQELKMRASRVPSDKISPTLSLMLSDSMMADSLIKKLGL